MIGGKRKKQPIPCSGRAVLALFFIAGISIVGCAKKQVKEEKWKWDDVVFLPAEAGMISAYAKAVSRDEEMCKDKSRVMAGDKIRLMISNSLASFVREGRKDESLTDKQPLLQFVTKAELQAVGEIKVTKEEVKKKEENFECKINLGLSVSKLLKIVREEAMQDSTLFKRISKYKIWRKLRTESVE